MKKLALVILFGFVSAKVVASDEAWLVGKSELGVKFKLLKSEWPVAFRCTHWGGPKAGKFMFSIRKMKTAQVGDINAWLIFPDNFGYPGKFYRDGLGWRFDWIDRNTNKKHSVVIKADGAGYYYNWSLANADGRMETSRTATCE